MSPWVNLPDKAVGKPSIGDQIRSAWQHIANSFGPPKLSPYQPQNKADVERPLYSQQAREATWRSAGLTSDPLQQSMSEYMKSMYAGATPNRIAPNRNWLGQMLAKEYENVPRQKAIMDFESRSPVPVVHFDSQDDNVNGSYDKGSKVIELLNSSKKPLPDILATLSHEIEHAKDDAQKIGTQFRPSVVNSYDGWRTKIGHHRNWRDYNTEKPLSDWARAAVVSGEDVNPNILQWRPGLLDLRKP